MPPRSKKAERWKSDDPGAPYWVGWKVRRWLAFQQEQGRSPNNPTALGRLVDSDNRTVEGWIKKRHRPRQDKLERLAHVMGVSLAWLVSPKRGWPPDDDDDDRLSALLADASASEKRAMIEALRDPKMRRALVAYAATLPTTPRQPPGARAPG